MDQNKATEIVDGLYELSKHQLIALRKAGCKSIGDLSGLKSEDILRLRNVGESTFFKVLEALNNLGYNEVAENRFNEYCEIKRRLWDHKEVQDEAN